MADWIDAIIGRSQERSTLGASGISQNLGFAEVLSGVGSPNNVVKAPVGSLYTRTDGGSSTTLYVKETGGNGASGWVAK